MLVTVPGLIDPHVHLREPGAEHKEDFVSGTRSALAGGFTAVVDMPNNPGAPTITLAALQDKMQRALARAHCDIGFHFGATAHNNAAFPEVAPSVFGLKLYLDHTTGDLHVEKLAEMRAIMAAWPTEKPLLVHAEDRTVAAVLGIIASEPRRVHFCHVSLGSEITMIREAKERGLAVTCEVAPHHLYLTERDADTLGGFGQMKPPLRTQEDIDTLWANINVIDMIATDHAPHTRAEKTAARPAFGIPGLETSLPLMLTAVAAGRLTLERLIDMMSAAPARVFAIPAPPDNFIEIDSDEEWTIDASRMFSKCDWTPFDGMKVRGRVKSVTLHGQLAFDGETILNQPGDGHVLTP